MRLTRQSDYAIRVMLDLAVHAGSRPVPRALIQARQDIPAAYLGKTVQALARAGLVGTQPGARGGVSLGMSPERVTLRQVIEAVEGPIRLHRCVSEAGGGGRDASCPAHPVWLRLQAVVTRELEAVSIVDLVAAGGTPPFQEAAGAPGRERPARGVSLTAEGGEAS